MQIGTSLSYFYHIISYYFIAYHIIWSWRLARIYLHPAVKCSDVGCLKRTFDRFIQGSKICRELGVIMDNDSFSSHSVFSFC